MNVIPYLFFDGRAEEALDFYRDKLGADIKGIHRFKDSPDPQQAPPGGGDKVMHATFTVGDTTANQGSSGSAASGTSFYLSANTALDASDVLLGSPAVAPLGPGQSQAGAATVRNCFIGTRLVR